MGLVMPGIEELTERGVLSPLDVHFARMLARIGGESRPEVLLAAALASRQVGEGHVCFDVEHPPPLVDGEGRALEVSWPAGETWAAALKSSRLVGDLASVSDHDGGAPLILDGGSRLYLRRFWWFEQQLARTLVERAHEIRSDVNLVTLRKGLDLMFDPPQSDGPDWQRVAAVTAVLRGLCVISGGPGTGKTFTVAKILALLAAQALERGQSAPRFTLVAPTGKAAARLGEAIGTAKKGLRCGDAVKEAIPEAASTIHRCLGAEPGGGGFRHGEDHPLATDLVLVDEASMVDLALMARLARAVPPRARLILLGDKDQLASVEAGAVLGDVCGGGGPREYSVTWAETVRLTSGQRLPLVGRAPRDAGLSDAIVELVTSYRYDAQSGIGRLARAINAGLADDALAALAGLPGVSLVEPGHPGELAGELRRRIVARYGTALREPDAPRRLSAFERFRVLCAHRQGGFGVEVTNDLVERDLVARGLVTRRGGIRIGTPLLVTRNDHSLRLYNGDVGLTAERDGEAQVLFRAASGEERWLSPSRLPPHETAFAMTVHKSQGSEFDEVLVLLPEQPSPVVTRELLYTAVTRARRAVVLYASREVLRQAIERRIERSSGLRDLLWRSA